METMIVQELHGTENVPKQHKPHDIELLQIGLIKAHCLSQINFCKDRY